MTKKLGAKTTERRGNSGPSSSSLSSPSTRSRRQHTKRSRRLKEDQSDRSKSRSPKRVRKKNGRANVTSSVSTSSISLTLNAIESMVTGVELLSRKDDGFESPSKATTKKTEKAASSEPQTDLILRLRLDVPSPVSESLSTTIDHEENPALFGTLGDGKSSIRVMLLNPDGLWSRRLISETNTSSENEESPRDWIVKIHGYAATEKFWHVKYQIFPIICLTSISILETCETQAADTKKKSKKKSPLGKPLFSNSVAGSAFSASMNFKAQAGTIGKFLKERGPFLTNEELAGSSGIMDEWFDATTTATNKNEEESSAMDCDLSTPLSRNQNFKKVHECLSRHSAMLTLQQSSSSPPSSPESANENPSSKSATNADDPSSIQLPPSPLKSKRPAQHAWELYDGALREFRTSQMDRQKASLGTNAGRESAERAELVVKQHNSALELALKEEGPLSIELLEQWHKELLKGLHPEAGTIRTRKVRCGHTVFCPPKRIRKELELYCDGLKSLELRLDMANNALHAVLFAAVAMFGIVDIHPFVDGNGRLSRIVANYALKQLPFPINLFATPGQRNEYVVAIERTRHVLSLNCAYGDVSRDDLIQVLKTTSVFGSLVQLLMDRVARATTALTAIWDEKSGLAAEAAEAKAARRVRERAARGTCMICLDEKPNIATLCCGNAIHLNCCAEWLSGNNKCPICRHEMPSISRRVVRAMEEPEERWEEEDDNSFTDLLQRRHPEVFSRDYHNFVDRFWNEIRNSRGRSNNSARQPNPLIRFSRFESDESDNDDEFQHTTTTTSDEGEDVGEPIPANANGQNNAQANREERTTGRSANNESGSDEEDGEHGDTTTTFEGEFEESDVSHSNTTLLYGSGDEHDTTFYSDASSHEPRRQNSLCCAAARCRNRPASDCVNSLCGRCCILIGNYHCPRHNS